MTASDREATAGPARPAVGPAGLRGAVWRIPLGWQLSTLYAVLLAVTLTVIGVQVYSLQQDFLVRDAAQRLVDNAQRVAGPPTNRPDGDGGGGGPGGAPGDHGGDGSAAGDQARTLASLVRGLSGPDVAV